MSMRARIGATAACVAVFLASWSAIHHHWYRPNGQSSDVRIYHRYAQRTVERKIPYRDFSIEYPPGFLLPALAPDATANPASYDSYEHAFQRWMAGAGVVLILFTALALTALRARPAHFAAALGFVAISPLLLGNVMLARFDLWVAALAIGGLAAMLAGRDRVGGALLGAAIATKIWPAVLVPLCLVWIAQREGRRAALRWLALAMVSCAAFFLPFAALAPGGLGHSFGLQINRPLPIESLGSTILIAAHNLAGLSISVKTSYGSQNLVAHGAGTMAALSTLVQILALCGIWVAFARGPARADRLVTAAAASVAAFVAFGKVFSPQYLIWLIPFVPLVRSRLATLLLGVSLVATLYYYPANYGDLILLEHYVTWIVLVRDLVVVTLAVELMRVLLERAPAEDGVPALSRHEPTPEAVPVLQT
ncbi:MAG: glycosyltransferase 87 family protein [Gaiellaceae bacterium]